MSKIFYMSERWQNYENFQVPKQYLYQYYHWMFKFFGLYLFIIIYKKYLHTVCTPTKSSTQSEIKKTPKILRNMFVTHWEMQHDAIKSQSTCWYVDDPNSLIVNFKGSYDVNSLILKPL